MFPIITTATLIKKKVFIEHLLSSRQSAKHSTWITSFILTILSGLIFLLLMKKLRPGEIEQFTPGDRIISGRDKVSHHALKTLALTAFHSNYLWDFGAHLSWIFHSLTLLGPIYSVKTCVIYQFKIIGNLHFTMTVNSVRTGIWPYVSLYTQHIHGKHWRNMRFV